jgi:hypothetical protein
MELSFRETQEVLVLVVGEIKRVGSELTTGLTMQAVDSMLERLRVLKEIKAKLLVPFERHEARGRC